MAGLAAHGQDRAVGALKHEVRDPILEAGPADHVAVPLDRVAVAAQKLNGITDEDIEELAEGFEDAPNEPSTSD